MKVRALDLPGLEIVVQKRSGMRAAGLPKPGSANAIARRASPMTSCRTTSHRPRAGASVDCTPRHLPPTLVQVLDAEQGQQRYLPAGFLHGYHTRSEAALLASEASGVHYPLYEITVRWDDPALGIAWLLREAHRLSDKDANADGLDTIPSDRLTRY